MSSCANAAKLHKTLAHPTGRRSFQFSVALSSNEVRVPNRPKACSHIFARCQRRRAMFRIEERESCGKSLVATQDLLPGTVVLRDSEPLMVITKEYLEQYKGHMQKEMESIVGAYSVFTKHMTSKQKEKYLKMFGPTTGIFAENMRDFANAMRITAEGCRPLTAPEKELFVQVGSILRLNSFGAGGGERIIYENACRMLHSCVPNCERQFEGTTIVIRAVVPIKAGEDLTIEYNPARSIETTAERRFQYQQFKEFTCRCPRCDAKGDDTRQFDCFDAQCTGRHYACQPLCNKPFAYADNHYTGVEYVEPHLLPCTACARLPPVEYQARMLAEEKRWEEAFTKLEAFIPTLLRSGPQALIQAIKCLELTPMPRWHRRTAQHGFLHSRLCIETLQIILNPANKAPVQEFSFNISRAVRALEVYESIRPNPHEVLEGELVLTMNFVLLVGNHALARSLCLRAIRMHLIRCGRESRLVEADKELVKQLQKEPSSSTVVSMDCCAFCEESPERAAMKRSRCGACKAVMYCSVGCQKAHWPVHKLQCKKV